MEDNSLAIQKAVFSRRPALKEIAEKYSGYSLKDYVQKHWQVPAAEPDADFLNILKYQLAEIYSPSLAETAMAQLLKKPLVSTIDHLGICNHPFFVNSDVIFSLAFEQQNLPIVLATESVSLNNSSSLSASFIYHQGGNLTHNSFLPHRLKNIPVFTAPAITANDVNRLKLATNGRFDEVINDLGLSQSSPRNFSTQAAQTSYKFWQKIFPSAPKIIYAPLETIILKYLEKVLENPDDFFYRLLLTKEGRGLWKKYFADEHTFMFWGIDENGRRQALTSLPESPSDVLSLITSRKIYPGSPLCFVVLLKAGLSCAGGFTQTSWLATIKAKLIEMMAEMGLADVEKIKTIATNNFAESYLAELKIEGQIISPSALDLYLSGKDYYPEYKKSSETMNLGQSLGLAMPSIYSVVVPKAEQNSR